MTWHTTKYGDPYSEFVLSIYPSKGHTHSSEHTHTLWTRAGLVIWHTGHFPGGPTHYRAGTCIYIVRSAGGPPGPKKCQGRFFCPSPALLWTHAQSSGQPFMLQRPRSSWGFVVLRVERALYIHSPHLQFLPARDSNSQPFDYESNSLTIRPRLQNLYYEVNYPFRQNSQFQYC